MSTPKVRVGVVGWHAKPGQSIRALVGINEPSTAGAKPSFY